MYKKEKYDKGLLLLLLLFILLLRYVHYRELS
jgi:hypothetical protein